MSIDILRLYTERTATEGLAAFTDAERARALLPDAAAWEGFLQSLPEGRLEDVIAALEAFEGEYPAAGVVPGVTTLLNLMPRLPERERGMFTLDARLVVTRVVLRLLRQLEDHDAVEEAVDEILPKLDTLSGKLELIGTVGYVEGLGHELISESKAAALQAELVEEVRNASDAQLAREWDLLRLLIAPRSWQQDPVVTITPEQEVDLHQAVFNSAKSEHRSQSMGSRAVKRTAVLAWEVLVDVYGSEENIKAALARLEAQKSVKGKNQETIKLVEKYLDGWRPTN